MPHFASLYDYFHLDLVSWFEKIVKFWDFRRKFWQKIENFGFFRVFLIFFLHLTIEPRDNGNTAKILPEKTVFFSVYFQNFPLQSEICCAMRTEWITFDDFSRQLLGQFYFLLMKILKKVRGKSQYPGQNSSG